MKVFASPITTAKRWSICSECDELTKVTKQCKKCKCFMLIKTQVASAKCPLDKSDSIIFVKPIYYKTNSWVSEYWIKTGMKKSPVYETLHISGDCLCGCFADSKELKLIEMFHPEVFKKIKDLEKLIDKEGTKNARKNKTWGNGSFNTTDIENQQTLDSHVESLVCNDCYLDRTNTDEDTEIHNLTNVKQYNINIIKVNILNT